MKDYLLKRIEGLTTGISGLERTIAEAEQFLTLKRAQLAATKGARDEAQEALAHLETEALKSAQSVEPTKPAEQMP